MPLAAMSRPLRIWQHLRHRLGRPVASGAAITQGLWQDTLQAHAFLQQLTPAEQAQLRSLCEHFLHKKQFTGVDGLVITNAMALSIAAQACVLLLTWGPPEKALRWYDDFVGIIVYPHDMRASRSITDAAGVVHHYQEELLGEAMAGGPIVLSWSAIQQPTQDRTSPHEWPARSPCNVVIHEFAHKLDMAHGSADGSPPLPSGFMGHRHAASARALWTKVWQSAYDDFCDALSAHTRFGQPAPWLDPYAAMAPAEFFAVACEAYWIDRPQMRLHHPSLVPLLDALFGRSHEQIDP